MTPIPILLVHWGDEGIRGSERVLLDLLARLDRARFAPSVWCNAEAMADAARSLDVSVRVSRMPILLGWDAPRFDLGAYRALVRQGATLIEELGARLVHANSGAPNQWMVPATRNARIPLVAHLHAIYGFRDRATMLLQQAPMIVGCSDAVVRPLRSDGLPESRLRVIPNGIDLTRLNLGEARGLRASLGIGRDSLLIVSAGALVHLKGFDVLLRAVKVVCEGGVDAHLAIAGEGPDRGALQALAAELGLDRRVHFLDQRPHLGAIIRDAADVVAVGSRTESFGLVAAEAGAMGLPTVATRVGGIAEVIDDGKTGLLVPSEDHLAFAKALEHLAGNPDLRRRLGAAARARVNERFTSDRAARSFEDVYGELLSQPAVEFGWSRLGFRVAPFARLGVAIVGRRLRVGVPDA